MSLEAWGDEGNVSPEGYVSEDTVEELEEHAFVRGAQAMREMLSEFVENAGHPELADARQLEP